MKKKYFLLLMLLFVPKKTWASVFYTDYELFLKNTTQFYEESDLLKREDNTLYQNYQLKKVNENYYLENSNIVGAPYIDKNDYIYEYKDYEKDYNNTSNTYGLGKVFFDKNYKYVRLYNFAENTKIKKLSIYYDDKLLNCTYDSRDSKDFSGTLGPDDFVYFYLDDFYDIKRMRFEFVFDMAKNTNIKFDLWISDARYKGGGDIATYQINFINHTNNYIFNVISNDKFVEITDKLSWVKHDKVNHFNYYKKQYKLYKYYDLEKEYIDFYSKEAKPNYHLDYSKKKVNYNYYKRDKIITNDTLKEGEPLSNIINSTTLDKDKISIKLTGNNILINYLNYSFNQKVNIIKSNLEEDKTNKKMEIKIEQPSIPVVKNEEKTAESIINKETISNQVSEEKKLISNNSSVKVTTKKRNDLEEKEITTKKNITTSSKKIEKLTEKTSKKSKSYNYQQIIIGAGLFSLLLLFYILIFKNKR